MKNTPSASSPVLALWAMVALAPILMILSFFIFGQWTWGLMDDHALALNAGTPDLAHAFSTAFNALGSGRGLRITYYLYTETFYSLFKNTPAGFYIFHALLFSLGLLLWGYLAFLFTKSRTAFVLVPAIALGCIPLYDGFFYLSVQEVLGVFLTGTMAVCMARIFLSSGRNIRRVLPEASGALLTFLLALVCKETLVAPLLVILSAFFIKAILSHRKKLAAWVILPLAITFGYTVWLKFFIQKGYSASYKFTDATQIFITTKLWFSEVFLGHLPWLCLILFVLWRYKTMKGLLTPRNFLHLGFGAALYLVYWIIVIPWNAHSYMAIPLGVFFAFAAAMILWPFLDRLNHKTHVILTGFFLILNIAVATCVLRPFAQYNQDTVYLLKWMKNDPYIQMAISADKHFGCNGIEPTDAIPNLFKLFNKEDMPRVIYTPMVKEILADNNMLIYFYNTRFGDQDLSRLKTMWTAIFTSENWVVFRRNY